MDIVFHLGAHRTGTTTFQAYLRDNHVALERAGIAFWGPQRTRGGLFRGLLRDEPGARSWGGAQKRAEGRVKLQLEQARSKGCRALLVSDENMIGSVRMCLRARALYPGIGERMARFSRAFGDGVTRIALCIRAQDRFWASAAAYGVARGHDVLDTAKLADIATSRRRWKDVITDLACAVPSAEIRVLPYDSFYADPVILMRTAVALDPVLTGPHDWLNRAPDLPHLRGILDERGYDPDKLPQGDGIWAPFSHEQTCMMQEQFADDLLWLAQGADGLATLTEEALPRERGKAHRAGQPRGHGDDEEGHLDQAG